MPIGPYRVRLSSDVLSPQLCHVLHEIVRLNRTGFARLCQKCDFFMTHELQEKIKEHELREYQR